MNLSHAAAQAAAAASPVQVAKAALRRLALQEIEPTPDNYARAYAAEGGQAGHSLPEAARPVLLRIGAMYDEQGAPGETLAQAMLAGRWDGAAKALDQCAQTALGQAHDWAALIERLAQGLERGNRSWTAARKKGSLLRVLHGSRSDARRLRLRIDHLLHAWQGDAEDPAVGAPDGSAVPRAAAQARPASPGAGAAHDTPPLQAAPVGAAHDWVVLVQTLEGTVRAALPRGEPRAAELAEALHHLALQVAEDGVTADRLRQADELCLRARRTLAHRQHLLDELGKLCTELTQGLTELAEDDSWARGQCEVLQTRLSEGLNVRSVRAASELLANARERQVVLRGERNLARDALKELIQGMLSELGGFAEQTGRFHDNIGRHAEAIAQADSLDGLASVVREMLHDSNEVQTMVSQTQQRLRAEQSRAAAMQQRVRELEGELRRLSDEVSTDALTQVANRRGLAQAFEAERARLRRADAEANTSTNTNADGLAVGLIDIDNFKKLNDTLGHAAGDVALQRLAAEVRDKLRPMDTVARFGGEEFVVLLPDTDSHEAQRVLTRLQRQLTAGLFMHDDQEVFVTFSAGVTTLRGDEALETALERADEALYEAKRTGKNRTCIA